MTAIKYIITVALVLGLMGVVSANEALAFEFNLNQGARRLATSWQVIKISEAEEEATVEATPDYSNRLINVATAPLVVTTDESETNDSIIVKRASKARKVIPAVDRVYPIEGKPLVLEGEASYYSRKGCLGCSPNLTMANGQTLNDGALTMAIGADKKHLVGRRAKVTNQVTGRSVEVTITDTGGFYQVKYGHRVADLTLATKQAIGMNGGVGQVKVEVY